MISLESDKMTDLRQNESLTFTFYVTFANFIPNRKKFFDLMISLESEERTALWPNDSLTFTFYVTFSNTYQTEQLL